MKDIALLFLIVIALLSAFIAYEFWRSKDGRLRILIIRLFLSKIWVYGGAAIAYTWSINLDEWVTRVILNAPMFIVMIQLYGFIRMKDK